MASQLPTTQTASPVIAATQGWVGTPYGWGEEIKGVAADCSGLVQGVFAQLGVKLPRTSQAQAATGVPVASLAQAQPGDLIFFDSDGAPNTHVGIYAGNGQMYDAPHTGTTVGLHSIQGYGNITAIRRENVASGSSAPIPGAVLAQSQDQRVQLAMLMGSHLEGGWGPTYSVGDHGTSFGAFQMHEGGALGNLPGNLTQQEAAANDPTTAVAAMLPSYQAAVQQVPQSLWQSNPEQAGEQAAVIAERPSQPYYTSQGPGAVDAAYTAALGAMGGAGSPTPSPSATTVGDFTIPGTGIGIPGTSSLNPTTWVDALMNAVRTPLLRAALVFVALVLFVVGVILIAGGASSDASSVGQALTPSDSPAPAPEAPAPAAPASEPAEAPAPRTGTRAKARAVPPQEDAPSGRSVPSGATTTYRPTRRSAGPSRGRGGGGGRYAMDADDAAEAAAL